MSNEIWYVQYRFVFLSLGEGIFVKIADLLCLKDRVA